jgi:SepF-like predicted cell division protein (DUF552 family)
MGLFSDIKLRFSGMFGSSENEEAILAEGDKEYVELNTAAAEASKGRVLVRPFVIDDFTDIKGILDSLREGSTIALINIKPLKDKDLIELKRVINKLKKTTDAIEGDIAGFGDDYIVVTPSFAKIYRTKSEPVKTVTEETF